jgi:Undecaprenyl-phosphate glucose phosphotransferase
MDTPSRARTARAEIIFTMTMLLLDVVMNVIAFLLAYRLRLLTEHQNVAPLSDYGGMLALQVVVMLAVFLMFRLYQRPRARSRLDEISAVWSAVTVGVLVTVALTTLLYKEQIDAPRLMVAYDWALAGLLISLGRLIHQQLVRALRARGIGVARVLIIGTTEVGRMIQQKIIHSPALGYRVVGYVTHEENAPKVILGAPVLGRIEDIPRIINEQAVDEVIVAMPEASRREILDILSLCDAGKVSIRVFPDVFQIIAAELSIGALDGLPLLTIRDPAMRGWRLAVKRAMDIIISALGLIFLSPMMLLTALLIKLDSPGPVFYYQERMGLDARPFWMIKYRSMRQDAEKDGPGWTRENDPRRTRLGAIIRRLSIDELPQLINVLLGDMSLVGPRPERPIYVEQFRRSIPRYMDRHREKAGITGWAQVNGLRGDTSIAERTKYDLWYIENWSLMLDIKILIRTVLKIFTDRQAY